MTGVVINPQSLEDEVRRLTQVNVAISESLRSVEALAWLDIDPAGGLSEICQNLAGHLRDTAAISHLGVFLMNPNDMQFELALAIADFMAPSIQKEFEAQLSSGMIGWAIRERRQAALPTGVAKEAGGTVILLPISTQRQVWALALCFADCAQETLPNNTLRLLNIVANHFGMALENGSLMETLSTQNQNLEEIVAKRSNELLAKTRALEQANEELRLQDAKKDDFISLVAHEIRTPLAGILSFSEFLQEDGITPEEGKEFGVSINREATRLLALVNDVLDLAKMEAGKLTYHYSQADLNALAATCVSSIKAAAQQRNISMKFEPDATLKPIRMAPDRIQQVIMNMLSNAIKFSEDGKEIIVATVNKPESVSLTVTDFGAGIAARDIPRVFNKFEQVESVTHHSKGTGFGMPISRNIIESGHGGKMWVESKGRGFGSTFYFILPIAAPENSTAKDGREL